MFSKISVQLARSPLQCRILKSYRTCLAVQRCTSDVAAQADSSVSADQDARPLTNIPFAKNLFVGKLDQKFLVYPQLGQEELEDLNQMVQPIEKYFNEALDSKSIDVNAKISEETLQEVKDLGLFGQQIPEEHGGLGLNATEFARMAEITALDGSIAVTLAAHQSIGLKGILIAGNDQQKAKYLPKLATGENVAAFCLTEPSSGSDAASIQTKATLSEDGKTFYLNGGKIWISNGGIAEIFTVFAKTEVEKDGETKEKVTAFVVERSFGGVTSGKPEDKLGIRGSNTCEVHFDNTPVPVENVLGEVGHGFKVAMNILNSGRFSMGSSGAGIIKKLMAMTAEHAISRKQFGKNLSEFRLIKEKFAKMAVTTYAMESMAYWTAGIIDQYQQPDCSLEAAMVKIFSSEGCWVCVNECLQILGGLGYMKEYPYERYLRDGRILMIFEGTNEILRMYVALNGLQHAGKILKEDLKLTNILANPVTLMKTIFSSADPKLTLQLHQEVHPSLKPQAEKLELYTLHLKRVVLKMLSKYKKGVVDEQIHLKRLADICTDLFGMTACIARTSRSYSIGLKNADHEMMLTKAFCYEAVERIQTNMKDLRAETSENNDDTLENIADTIFKNHGYAAAHPLERNW